MAGLNRLKEGAQFWFAASRAPFFIAVVTSTFLGTTIAWAVDGVFHWAYFLLTLLAVMLVNGGTNLANDYYDYKSSNDQINVEYIFPFTGGSRMIQKGLLKPSQVLRAGIICFVLAALLGLYLAWARGWVLLALGAFGILTGFFYTAPPLKLGYRWIGELVVGLNCGILVTLGAYYVQAQQVTWLPVIAALPLGLLIAAVLWINEIPDYTADKAVGKQQLVVRLGRKRAAKGYVVLLASAYLTIILGICLHWISSGLGPPLLALLGFLTLPLAVRNIKLATTHYDSVLLAPANATTPILYLGTGLLICLGFTLDKLVIG